MIRALARLYFCTVFRLDAKHSKTRQHVFDEGDVRIGKALKALRTLGMEVSIRPRGRATPSASGSQSVFLISLMMHFETQRHHIFLINNYLLITLLPLNYK
jgi:hypothetical protein